MSITRGRRPGRGADPGANTQCVSFEIHENLSGAEAKTIDVQEFLREEFGSDRYPLSVTTASE